MCDKCDKSDKRIQSNEQEVCEELVSPEFEKEGVQGNESEKKETEEERKKERGSKAEEVRGKGSEEVEGDAMDWTVVTRRTRKKRTEGQGAVSEDKRTLKSRDRTIQIFVKVDGCKVLPLEMSPNDKVGDVVRRILRRILSRVRCESRDVYVTSGGRVLRRSEELRSFGVVEGSTVCMSQRLRGGGVHNSKQQNKQKKRESSEQREKERQCQEHEVKGDAVEWDVTRAKERQGQEHEVKGDAVECDVTREKQ